MRYRRPMSEKAPFARAEAARRAGDTAAARRLYAAVPRDAPMRPEACYNCGVLALDAGQPAAALVPLREAVAARPDDPDMLHALGVCLRQLGRPEAALNALRLAHAAGAAGPAAAADLAMATGESGDWAAAAEALFADRQHWPGNARLANAHGRALAHGQAHAAAADAFRSAVALAPGFLAARRNLAAAWQRLGYMAEARAQWEAVLARRPDDAEARFGRATVRLAQGDWAEGFADYEARRRLPRCVIQRVTEHLQY